MTVKSADIQTFAPRLSYLEDLTAWLKDNRGTGTGGISADDKRLWRATLLLSHDTGGGTQTNDTWATPTYYEAQNTSLHCAVFGFGVAGVTRTSTRPLYDQLFVSGDTRWSTLSESFVSTSLSTEALGLPEDGFTTALRAQFSSLAKSIFREPAQMSGAHPTIIDKIEHLQTQIDDLQTQIGDLASDLAFEVNRLDNRINSLS